MSRKLKWTDAEEIGVALHEQMPSVDPLAVRFSDLRDWVCQLAAFEDDPAASTEQKLEAIQMAWLEEYQESG
jgi:FeS assembly protein IscX